ncbi:transcription termination factor Rho [Streptacidiphilus jiangxiensis]|uniref:Transcription termination factor Rho n=2 Tax=Streptacidiphilus jiangxiensis TaxID=235985 RepID=A0A1H7Z5V2_STRJI|nr:transcription termination factor Rho [Streptacidiphilus jiangxiensis]SEM52859.1 transcription termination factor Rho [Streptacidiphilus jiangxiensis]
MTTVIEPSLDHLLRAELHQLATSLGVTGAGRLRKGELVEAITAKRAAEKPAPERAPAPTDPDHVSGVLDIRDGNAFLRVSGYQPGPGDLFVSQAQVRNLGLRTGDAITGAVAGAAPAVKNGRGGKQERRPGLARIETVNGQAPERARVRADFADLTPLHPTEQLRLETDQGLLSTRLIDLVAPIGKGQRGLVVAPPKTGKTVVLQAIAAAVNRNHPDAHLMVLLIDERPEEVTDMRRSVRGEVLASTFDRPAREHIALAELAIERAKRLVELGQDVVVLLDSITRLARAYNTAAPASGRILSGGVDAAALHKPKRFFGAARNVENGGSLTIIATALVDTGSKMDDLIFEEFKSTGNMELRLDRRLAEKRIFPAVDAKASGTRREELLLGAARTPGVRTLRRVLSALDTQQATELLLDRLKQSPGNTEFLRTVATTAPRPDAS